MMRARVLLVLAAGGLLGCSERTGDPGPEAARAAPSADAFCVEHGVAEAVCTKCNPKLAAIFQEKGDWCAEHGLPESFCPTCHPELGGRPAVSLEPGGPATGTRVQLAGPETARTVGIETTEARAEDVAEVIEVLGTVTYDASKRAEVNARARGVVREILVEVGAWVEEGTPLIRIESAEIGAEQSRLITAGARCEVARLSLERTRTLFDKGMAAQKDLLEAQLELDTARADQAASQAALGIVGISGADAGGASSFTLTAPLAGTCLHRSATIGRMVAPDDVLCEIVDTRTMWAELDIPESALARVLPGQEVLITSPTLAGRELAGRIDYVAPEIDRHTRTTKARVRLENEDGALRANLFVRARIALGPKQARVLVPRGALQEAGGADLVFVELTPGSYEARRVTTASRAGALIALSEGVLPGERVVVAGSFLLKTETLKGEIGAGCCEEN